jgi:MFS transporter, SP family, arabinose:H+ symporter
MRLAHLIKHLIAEAITASLGGFVFGYDLGAISSATQSLRSQFDLSPGAFGITISFSLWGTVAGSLLAGLWADRMSRRRLIVGCAVLYALAACSAMLPIVPRWTFLLVTRFLCGIAIGGFTVGCPLYLAELAPIDLRGRIVSLFQVQVGLGVVVAFGLGSLFARLNASHALWKWCLGAGTAPAVVLLLLLAWISGRSLDNGGCTPSRTRVEEPAQLVIQQSSDERRLFSRKNLRPILLATSIALFNQLSGVNIVLLYMLDILASAGIGFNSGHTYTMLISCMSLITTVLAMSFVDRAGRKPLLYIGSVGMAICLLWLALAIPYHFRPLSYLSILVAYNTFFAFSQGTVVWVYLSELFPPGIRGKGQGYGASVHWIVNATLIMVFPLIQHATPVLMFYMFGIMMALQIVVIWRCYPETRGSELGLIASGGA